MHPAKRYLQVFLVLSLFLGLAAVFRSFLMADVIRPIALLLWAGWRIITSVDQNTYWILLIVVCIILIVRTLPAEKEHPFDPSSRDGYAPLSLLEHWQKLINDAPLEKETGEDLHNNLRKLLTSAVAEAGQVDHSTDWDKPGTSIEKSIPQAARHFLSPFHEKHSGYHQLRLLRLAPKWLQKWISNYFPQDRTSVDQAIKWMESVMEINHDE